MDPRDPNPFDAVAWRAPEATRFDGRPANDVVEAQDMRPDRVETPASVEPHPFGRRVEPPDEPVRFQHLSDIPGWAWAVFGGVVAALLGALAGGAFQVT